MVYFKWHRRGHHKFHRSCNCCLQWYCNRKCYSKRWLRSYCQAYYFCFNQIIPVTSLTVTRAGGSSSITGDNGSLQLSITVLPANALDKSVSWSVLNDTGQASINSSGLVTAIDNGTITAKATANDGSGISGLMDIPVFIENSELKPVFVTRNEIRIPLNSGYISC